MDTDMTTPAVDALALAMMNSLGQLSLILGHMQRYQAEGSATGLIGDELFIVDIDRLQELD